MMKMKQAAVAMAVIIAVRMELCWNVSIQVGEIFTDVAATALVLYACMRTGQAVRQRAAMR